MTTKTKKNSILSRLLNKPESSIPEYVYYTISEKNYYNILHYDSKRNFGHYQHSELMSQEDKAATVHYSLNLYIHKFDINCVTINKQDIEITITKGDFVYKHILSNNV